MFCGKCGKQVNATDQCCVFSGTLLPSQEKLWPGAVVPVLPQLKMESSPVKIATTERTHEQRT